LLNDKKELEYCSEKIGEGLRNAYMCSIGGVLRSRGVSYAGIIGCLQAENLQRCDPPLKDMEVRAIARSMMQYQPKYENQKIRITKNANLH
jgi:hypothetical protein